MMSLMTLDQHKNKKIRYNLKRETMCKLINRIPGRVFRYQVYQARLRERMLNRSTCLAMSISVLEALPGKIDIKRHSPSILYA